MDKITHMISGQMCWGAGTSFEEAKKNFKDAGGRLTGQHWLYTFGGGSEFMGVDGMGCVHFSGPEPIISKLR